MLQDVNIKLDQILSRLTSSARGVVESAKKPKFLEVKKPKEVKKFLQK